MATELASGYVSLTVRYGDAMKQLNKDFANVAKTANQTGTKAGQQFSQGVQRQSKGITQSITTPFTTASKQAGQAGQKSGSAFSTGFKNSTKNMTANMGNTFKGATAQAQKGGMDVGAMFGTGMKAGIAGAAVAVVGAVVSVLKEATQTGIDFARQLNNMKGVTGATAQEMERVSAAAKALGSDTKLAGSSSADAAAAMTELAKAGFTVEESITAARGVLQLSTAAQISAAQAAEVVATQINTFGLSAKDAAMVVDDLAAAANASAIDIPDLALAMQAGGNASASFGISLQDTITALATFAQLGVKGSDAGTLMKTSLLAWQSPSENQATAMAELNLQLSDAQGNFVGYREMLRQLEVASKSMTQEQFNNAAATLYGTDAFRAAAMAKNGAIPIFDRIRGELDKEGQAAKMAGAQMEGLPGVVEGLKNAWEGIKLSIFEKIKGPLIAVGQAMIGLMSGDASQLPSWLQQIMGHFQELWAAVKGPLAEAFATAKAAFIEALPIFKAVATVLGVTLVVGVKAASVIWPIMINSLTQSMNVFRAFAAVVTGAWDAIAAAFQFGKDVVTAALDGIKGAIDSVQGAFTALKDFMSTVFNGVGAAIKATFSGIVESIKAPLREVGRVLQGLPVIDAGPVHIDVTGFGDKLAGLRKGGPVRGRGGTDNVLAWLTAGEGVVTKAAMQGGGSAVVAALNAGTLPGFKKGGVVDANPGAQFLAAEVMRLWPQITSIGGRRSEDGMGEHSSGNALDIMIPGYDTPAGKALGDAVASFIRSNWGVLGADGMIWRQASFGYGGSSSSGKPMDDRGSDTQNHMDHVHIILGEGRGAGAPSVDEPTQTLKMPSGKRPGGRGSRGGGGGGGEPAVPLTQTASGAWTSPNAAWAALIERESGGQNIRQGITDVNSGGNEAEGIFQITPGTWKNHGGTEFAPNPMAATPEEQAIVAARILAGNPTGGDWGAGLPGRENAADLLAGLETSAADGTAAADDITAAADSASDALSENPYTALQQLAEKQKELDQQRAEAVKKILPDFGAMADIGVEGIKETFLPPGFSDPTQWGALKMGAGLMGFASGLTNDPTLKGLLGVGSAALSGSGSGVVSAIEGMIPAPFGAATPVAVGAPALGGGLGAPSAPFGALGAQIGAPAVGGQLGGPPVDNSVHIGQVNDDANKVLDKTARQQTAAQRVHLGTRRFV